VFLGVYDAMKREKKLAERRAENKSYLMDPIEEETE
jgi:hypothetical protein